MLGRPPTAEEANYLATDVDGTLLNDSVFRIVMERASRLGIIEPPNGYDPYKETITDAYLRTLPNRIGGLAVTAFDPVLREMEGLIGDKLHGFAMRALATAADEGYALALVSQSPQPWVEAFARTIGSHAPVDLVYGSHLGQRDGRYTGEVITLDKASVMANFGYKIAAAMGDTSHDAPLIKAALSRGGKAVVVGNSSDGHLRYHQALHGQPIPPPIITPDRDGGLWLCSGPIGPQTPDARAYLCAEEAITTDQFLALLGLEGS